MPLLLLLLAAAQAKCPPAALSSGRDLVALALVEQQPALAAQHLARSCTFAGPLQQALQRLPTTSGAAMRELDRQLGASYAAAWSAACPGGLNALSAAMPLGPAEAHGRIYADCRLETLGLFTAAEFGVATGSLTVPVLVAWELHQAGADPDIVRVYGRALAGVPVPPPTRATTGEPAGAAQE